MRVATNFDMLTIIKNRVSSSKHSQTRITSKTKKKQKDQKEQFSLEAGSPERIFLLG